MQVVPRSKAASILKVGSIAFVVYGVCYSMKNSRSPNGRGGTYKHAKARKFEEDFALQVPPGAKVGMGGRKSLLRASVTVYYPSWRQDADFALIYDLLQKTGVVSNDRWIRERHEWAKVDTVMPRVHVKLEYI